MSYLFIWPLFFTHMLYLVLRIPIHGDMIQKNNHATPSTKTSRSECMGQGNGMVHAWTIQTMPNVNGFTVVRSNRTISTKRFAWSLDDITLQYWESRPLNQDIAFCAFSWFIEYSNVNAFLTNDSIGSTNLLLHWPIVLWSYLRIQDSTALYINTDAKHRVEHGLRMSQIVSK